MEAEDQRRREAGPELEQSQDARPEDTRRNSVRPPPAVMPDMMPCHARYVNRLLSGVAP
jgi:hypothetical protein